MSDQLIEYLGRLAVPVVVLLTFRLARKYMSPASAKAPGCEYPPKDLEIRFRDTQWVVGVCMLVVGVLFAFSTHAAFVWLNGYLARVDGPAEFTLLPQTAIWWFFPGFGALALSWQITLELWSIVGSRDEAHLYNYWSIQKTGFDSPRLLGWMAILIALPIGVLTFLELRAHTVLRADDIRACGYAFAPCKTYRYVDARRMTIIDGFRDRNGKLTRRAGVVVDFSAGHRWSSADIGDFNDRVDPTLADFLQKKTNLQFSYAQTEGDIPRLNPAPE